MAERDEAVRAAALRHGLSVGAVDVLWDALVRGHGQAQFSHPDLGGMGQWSGGMLQIGGMFNADLKAKVAAACADLAARLGESREEAAFSDPSRPQRQGRVAAEPASGPERLRTSVPRTGFAASDAGLEQSRRSDPVGWWPGRYGAPASSGSQNAMRYAYFPDQHRLVVDRDGHITVYDTCHHRLSGVSQAQDRHQSLVFTSQHGSVGPESFVEVDL